MTHSVTNIFLNISFVLLLFLLLMITSKISSLNKRMERMFAMLQKFNELG
jgi:hypothetical protein